MNLSAFGLSYRLIEARADAQEAIQAMIKAGRGTEPHVITLCCTDALSVRYVAAIERMERYQTEGERRLKCHGSLKPITLH